MYLGELSWVIFFHLIIFCLAIFYLASKLTHLIHIFPVFHGDASRRVGDAFPRFLCPGDLGTPGETFPPTMPLRIFFFNVFPLFSLLAIPTWYYLENKSIYLVFSLHNIEYISNELLFFIFYFIFIILETSPRPP